MTLARDTSDHLNCHESLAMNTKEARKNSFNGTRSLYPPFAAFFLFILLTVRPWLNGKDLRKFLVPSEAGPYQTQGPASWI